jgi:hypothetical protein
MSNVLLFLRFYGAATSEERDDVVAMLRAAGIEAEGTLDPVPQPRTGSGGAPWLGAEFVFQHADAVLTGLVTSAAWGAVALAFMKLRKRYAGVSLDVRDTESRGNVTYHLPLTDADELRTLLESIPKDFDITVASYMTEHVAPSGETWRTAYVSVMRAQAKPPDPEQSS